MAISARTLRLLHDLCDGWANLNPRVEAYDDELAALTRDEEQTGALATIPGIGVINATGLFAVVCDAMARFIRQMTLMCDWVRRLLERSCQRRRRGDRRQAGAYRMGRAAAWKNFDRPVAMAA